MAAGDTDKRLRESDIRKLRQADLPASKGR